MDEKDPYPALLGIDWAFDNLASFFFFKDTITFEADGTRVVQSLDPN
jgi:hypothetical protein